MTSYDEIYSRFLNKITDYKLLNLDDKDVTEMMHQWLLSSISKFKKCKSNLNDRDEDFESFNITLLDVEIEILSLMMVVEWLAPQLNSTLLTSQFFGSKEEKFYSQANQLDKLLVLSSTTENQARKLIRDYTYQSFLNDNLS